jgi:hypothetical protein
MDRHSLHGLVVTTSALSAAKTRDLCGHFRTAMQMNCVVSRHVPAKISNY